MYFLLLIYRLSSIVRLPVDYQDPRSKIRSVHEESSCAYTLLFSLFSCLLFLLNTARRSDGQTVRRSWPEFQRIQQQTSNPFKSRSIKWAQHFLIQFLIHTLCLSQCVISFRRNKKCIHHPQSTIHNPQSTIHNPQSTIQCILHIR